MLVSKITNRYVKTNGERICQGDILKDIRFTLITGNDAVVAETPGVLLRYAVVLSQDCDLDRDFADRKSGKGTHDKLLPTILVCPAYPSEQFLKGEHIERRNMNKFSAAEFKKIKANNDFGRYHFLHEETSLSLTDLIIDFKHFYTVPTEILTAQFSTAYIATVNELFRERLSQRFANYLSRFGLPEFAEAESNAAQVQIS